MVGINDQAGGVREVRGLEVGRLQVGEQEPPVRPQHIVVRGPCHRKRGQGVVGDLQHAVSGGAVADIAVRTARRYSCSGAWLISVLVGTGEARTYRSAYGCCTRAPKITAARRLEVEPVASRGSDYLPS